MFSNEYDPYAHLYMGPTLTLTSSKYSPKFNLFARGSLEALYSYDSTSSLHFFFSLFSTSLPSLISYFPSHFHIFSKSFHKLSIEFHYTSMSLNFTSSLLSCFHVLRLNVTLWTFRFASYHSMNAVPWSMKNDKRVPSYLKQQEYLPSCLGTLLKPFFLCHKLH